MEQKDKDGIESIVEHRQKKDIVGLIGAYAGTIVSGIGAAGSVGMIGFSVYKAIAEYAKLDPSMVQAVKAMDEASPYDNCHGYLMIAIMAGIATFAFGYGVLEGIRCIRLSRGH